jgi:glutathione peroxidase
MRSKIFWLTGIVLVMGLGSFITNRVLSSRDPEGPVVSSLYDIKMKSLKGEEVDFSSFKGKRLLIVNTASKCGKTPQYADLQKLHDQLGDKITVLGFPANNFFWQEPGENADIAEFCELNYGVKFRMFEKISVKGRDQHPLYQWLQSKTGQKPDWNFAKYLVSEDGSSVEFFSADIKVFDPVIFDKIIK